MAFKNNDVIPRYPQLGSGMKPIEYTDKDLCIIAIGFKNEKSAYREAGRRSEAVTTGEALGLSCFLTKRV